MSDLGISILLPVYNGERWIKDALESILSQSFKNYEIIIVDDASTDNTVDVIKSFKDDRIKFYTNEINQGEIRSYQICWKKATKGIIFLMAADDILLTDALLKTYNAFKLGDDIGVVTRPYYLFLGNVRHAVKAVRPYDKAKDRVLSIFDGEDAVRALFGTLGASSGLAYRKEYMSGNFRNEEYTFCILPFALILKKYKGVFLKDYTMAVRIESSGIRRRSDIFSISPTDTMVKMFNDVYSGDRYDDVRKVCIDLITKEYAGLVQIKNYSSMKLVMREIRLLLRYRWLSIFDPRFWFFCVIAILTPRKMLAWLADEFERKILSRTLKDIVVGV